MASAPLLFFFLNFPMVLNGNSGLRTALEQALLVAQEMPELPAAGTRRLFWRVLGFAFHTFVFFFHFGHQHDVEPLV